MVVPLFSVVIPVFNSEKYLSRCIDSIISQDYTDFELVLIDDCSTDGSYAVCCSYAQTDSRIRALRNEKNEGVTVTRNRGIEESTGSFVLFVDNDDYLEKNYLSTFASAYNANPDADLFVQKIIFHKEHNGIQILSGFDSLGGPWGKMFKRSILIKDEVRFIPKLRYNEDNMFMLDYLEHIEKKIELDVALYHYTENEDCTSKKLETDYVATGKGLMILLERLDKDCFKTQFNKDFAENRAYFMFHRYVKSLFCANQSSHRDRVANIKKVCKVYPCAIDFYPNIYRADKFVVFFLRHHLYSCADVVGKLMWTIRTAIH